MRRPLLPTRGGNTGCSLTCVCFEKMPAGIVCGSALRTVKPMEYYSNSLFGSVAALVRHHIEPVCTWKSRVLDTVSNGKKEFDQVLKCESEWRFRKFSFFDKQWDISVSRDATGHIEPLSKDEEISEVIQIKLLDHEACLLTLSDQVCLILKHEDYYVVFDPNIRDSCGMATHRDRSALVFNTSFLDLMHHIDNLVASLRAEHYTVVGINVTQSHPSINGNYSDACNEIDAGCYKCQSCVMCVGWRDQTKRV